MPNQLYRPPSTETDNRELPALLAEAMDTTIEGIIISDALQPGNPVIYVNKGFERLTGYSASEVIGSNCRFLQGAETDKATTQQIRRALQAGEECTVEILNYRKDGSAFWNRFSVTPLRDADGRITHYVGVQFNITELKETKVRLEKANDWLERFHREMIAQLAQARQAQEAILLTDLPSSRYFRAAVRFVPLAEIGGDFYDVFRIDEHSCGFMIADVTGHGIPAALLTFMSSAAFKSSTLGHISTREVLEETNRRLVGKMPFGTFASMFYMIYRELERELIYSQAGHPPAVLASPSKKQVSLLTTKGTLIGVFPPEQAQWDELRVTLQPGDKVIMYTDAVLEASSRRSHKVEIDRLCRLIKQHINDPIDDLLDAVYAHGISAKGDEYTDDVTLLGFEVLE